MTREEFIKNFVESEGGVILTDGADVRIVCNLIGAIYDQQQMIDYLDTRLIDLEREIYR